MFEVARFEPALLSVGECRRWLARCVDGEVDAAVAIDAQLCVSELAADAVRHAATPYRVDVQGAGPWLRIAVHDDSNDPPVPLDVGPGSPGGRGLSIVEAVALRWGWALDPGGGKDIWCEIGSEPPAS